MQTSPCSAQRRPSHQSGFSSFDKLYFNSFRSAPCYSGCLPILSQPPPDILGFLAKRFRVFLPPGRLVSWKKSLLFTTHQASSRAQCSASTSSLSTQTLTGSSSFPCYPDTSQLCLAIHSTDTCCTVHPACSTSLVHGWHFQVDFLPPQAHAEQTELLFFPVKSTLLHDRFYNHWQNQINTHHKRLKPLCESYPQWGLWVRISLGSQLWSPPDFTHCTSPIVGPSVTTLKPLQFTPSSLSSSS